MVHYGTIKKYTAALLSLFNEVEIQYQLKNGDKITKNIPLRYSSREKSKIFDEYTSEQILTGNYNVLPRSSLSLVAIIKSEERIMNKNMKINRVSKEDEYEYMYNSVPYEFTYELNVQCRGMNEATMIIEQILPKFNPIYNIDIWDVTNLSEPTRVPVKLLDVSIESEEYEELSQNIMNVTMSFSLQGNIFPPVKNITRIKDFKILLNEQIGNYYNTKAVMGWDVDDGGHPINPEIGEIVNSGKKLPNILDMMINELTYRENDIDLFYNLNGNDVSNLKFEWEVINIDGYAEITSYNEKASLYITKQGTYEIQVTITDIEGNFINYSKRFNTINKEKNIPGDINEGYWVIDLNLDYGFVPIDLNTGDFNGNDITE